MNSPSRAGCIVLNLSRELVKYSDAWKFQKVLAHSIFEARKTLQPITNGLIVLQHESIYTLGKGATTKNLKFAASNQDKHEVVRVERGGEVTWHGPGQIVAYPIFNLNDHKRDLHWFANSLEQSVINVIKKHDVLGERSEVNTGVWVGKDKISAIGVTASRWITMHGIALNVNCDLEYYNNIVPCGIDVPDRGVTSLKKLKDGVNQDIEQITNEWIQSFASIFNLNMIHSKNPRKDLDDLLIKYPHIAELKLDRSI